MVDKIRVNEDLRQQECTMIPRRYGPFPYSPIIDRPKRIYVQPPIVPSESTVPGIRQTGAELVGPVLTEI